MSPARSHPHAERAYQGSHLPLTTYVHDGRLPIDNNAVERDLRALTIGRKNGLFIGSRQAGPRAAILYTVVAGAARHNLDLWAYLRDVLVRLATGEKDLVNLLPDDWAAVNRRSSSYTSGNSFSAASGSPCSICDKMRVTSDTEANPRMRWIEKPSLRYPCDE